MTISVRPLNATDDAAACDAVLVSLPYFFGDPDGQRDCALAVRSQPGFVATVDGEVAGFITLLQHLPDIGGSTEITWMAVQADHRRHGLGAMLIDAAVERCREDGVPMLSVLTLGLSVPEEAGDNYEGTRAFYRRVGFVPLRELALRDWNDAWALILARAIEPA